MNIFKKQLARWDTSVTYTHREEKVYEFKVNLGCITKSFPKINT